VRRVVDRETHIGETVIDVSGFVVAPGFVDLHCHVREPGFEDAETIATGTRAAAAGGFTTVCALADTRPSTDTGSDVEALLTQALRDAVVRVLPIGTTTKQREGKELSEMADMAEVGAVAFSDDGRSVRSASLMRHALEYSLLVERPISSHAEDADLAADPRFDRNSARVAHRAELNDLVAKRVGAMGTGEPPCAAYSFARFTLDRARGALRGPDGAELPLRTKSFALLRLLLESAGRLLDRDTIMRAIWPDGATTRLAQFGDALAGLEVGPVRQREIGDLARVVVALGDADLAGIVVTDTVPVSPLSKPDKLTVLPVSGLLAETIMNVFADDSVSAIFAGENQLF